MKKASSRLSPACCLFRCLQRGAGGWKGQGKEVSTTVMSYNIHHGVGLDEH